MRTRSGRNDPARSNGGRFPRGNGAPSARHENLAARMGRWSAHHRKKAIFGWLAFVVIAFMVGKAIGLNSLQDADSGVKDSGRADKTVDQAFPKKAEETVLVQSKNLKADDPAFVAGVNDVVKRLDGTKDVRKVESPYARDKRANISADGHSALVDFEVPGDSDQTETRVAAPLAAVAGLAKAHPNLRIEEFGDASAAKAVNKKSDDDFAKAETTSLPLTLAILLIAFGTLVAAGIPLLLAITGVLATLGLVGVLSQISPVSDVIKQVILLVGLAVGVDYALFYLKREREERAAGRGEEASLEAAAATSGRAVLISGFTVMFAMAGMYFAGSPVFESFATGTIAVVAVSVIGSLTVLPAVLSKLGDRVEKGRVPLLWRLRDRAGGIGLWPRIVDGVLRRPVVALLVAGGFLIALAVPTLRIHTAVPGYDTYSRDLPVIRTYDRIQAAFPSEAVPATVVVKAENVTSPAVHTGIARLESAARDRQGLFLGPATVDVSPDRTVETVSLPTAGDGSGTDAKANAALDALRDDIVPATVDRVDGVQADVTGAAAGTRDFNDSMKSHLPYVFAFVLTAAFLLLLITFRSIVIPIKAILLNLLSVAAAYGILVLVFQDGHGQGLLGFTSNGAITPWLPLFLFVILFGLSMDYHVFILTRVREAFDAGMSTSDAVSHAIKRTAGTVTSAAVVMVGVFALFATLSDLELKQLGVGLASAILIDATIIRGVLLPASMKLLGDWNWYLPKWLEWLPRVSPEAPAEPPVEPVVEPVPEPAPV